MRNAGELLYTKTHEWVDFQPDGSAIVGISEYAQDAIGDLVFVNFPEVGDEITAGESFADIESVKSVFDVYAPVTGTIATVHEALQDTPESINEAPYEAWLVTVNPVTERGELMNEEEYLAFCETE